MFIHHKPRWAIHENDVTPERHYWSRRALLGGVGLGTVAALGAGAAPSAQAFFWGSDRAADAPLAADPTADLYPAARNEVYTLDRPVTDERQATTYNNFYEFGTHKQIWRAAQRLPVRPWTVRIEGEVEQSRTVDVDTLIRSMALEERLYRFRCVEAWSMAVPWTGFPLASLVAFAKPLSSAKYVVLETFGPSQVEPSVATGFRQSWYPWPYTEGLTIAEATSELAFIATGIYGKPLPPQNGAPLRLVVPWKYGFKSVKSLVRIRFTDTRPKTFWEALQSSEYGFWANVNPAVSHPRWSQASERVLGTGESRPTLLFNGYAEQVAHLYKGLEGERLFA